MFRHTLRKGLVQIMNKEAGLRGFVVVISTLAVGVGVGFFRISCFGSDPYTAMNAGVSSLLSMPFGTYQLLFNAILIAAMVFWAKELVGFGTIFNMIFVGYSADFTLWVLKMPLQSAFGTAEGSELPVWIRILFLFLAFWMFCLFIAAYIAADFGIAPYDALSIMLEKACKGKIPFKMARIIVDCIAAAIAFISGISQGKQWQMAGVGTICIACFSGPIISRVRDWVGNRISDKANA